MTAKMKNKPFQKVADGDRKTILKTVRFSQKDIERTDQYCETNNLHFADLVRLGINAICDRVGGQVRVSG